MKSEVILSHVRRAIDNSPKIRELLWIGGTVELNGWTKLDESADERTSKYVGRWSIRLDDGLEQIQGLFECTIWTGRSNGLPDDGLADIYTPTF